MRGCVPSAKRRDFVFDDTDSRDAILDEASRKKRRVDDGRVGS